MPLSQAADNGLKKRKLLVEAFRRAAAGVQEPFLDTAVADNSWNHEVQRIDSEARRAWSELPTSFISAFYLRKSNPLAEDVLRLLRVTSKAFELNLRLKEIEQLDEIHAKLWALLTADKTRLTITLAEYLEILDKFHMWYKDSLEGSSMSLPQRETSFISVRQEYPYNMTPLEEVMYLASTARPYPSVQLYLSCPRSPAGGVEVALIWQMFSKQISFVKCEAELMMWDTNNDGCLTEDEMESYVRDLAPRIDALRNLTEDLLPFYCCTVSRRIFWLLDPGSRGSIRIDALLQSPLMDEWVCMQLMREDQPRNWFSAAVTSHLYDKFLLLDSRNHGTLNAENMKKYKKGLPTIVDDGLPQGASPLSPFFVDRFFETNVMMAKSELDFRKFVDFVLAVEFLPICQRPVFFWNILDIDGNGFLRPVHVNYFFRETHSKLVAAGLKVPSKETVVEEVFDLIPTAEPLCITREEFINAPNAGLFVALLIDCIFFWTYENREQR